MLTPQAQVLCLKYMHKLEGTCVHSGKTKSACGTSNMYHYVCAGWIGYLRLPITQAKMEQNACVYLIALELTSKQQLSRMCILLLRCTNSNFVIWAIINSHIDQFQAEVLYKEASSTCMDTSRKSDNCLDF